MKPVVASGHIRVTEAACETLKNGGNAFDAVVAAGFASVVAEPPLTSLGGGGFLLARPTNGKAVLYDFFADTPGRGLQTQDLQPHFLPVTVHFPGSEQVFNVGQGSAAVPGTLRGLLYTHRALGRLPLQEVIAPAVQLARDGVPLNRTQAYVLDLLHPIMTLTQGAKNIFAPGGEFLREGDRYVNRDLASFLEILPAAGDRPFYEGELAQQIASDMREHGGLLTREDFSSYHVIERKPLTRTYRHYQLLTNPPPSFGGALLAYSLLLLQRGMVEAPEFGTLSHLAGLITLMQEVHRSRERHGLLQGENSDDRLSLSVEAVRRAFGGTTHVSIVDQEGNAASLSCSNGEGSGYVVPGTGIMLNNMMGEDDLHPDGFHASPPGLRVASMMSPSVLLKENRVCLVVGSGGSKRIRTALLQVLSNVIDFGMNIHEAIESPRLHWDGDLVQIEPGFEPEILAELKQRWPVNVWQVKDVYFGGVHAASALGEGAGDSRRDGAAATLQDLVR
ncbi:MAG: gamma-glutamyltransferase family protein [bacterium]